MAAHAGQRENVTHNGGKSLKMQALSISFLLWSPSLTTNQFGTAAHKSK
jgi:hypothetical protein